MNETELSNLPTDIQSLKALVLRQHVHIEILEKREKTTQAQYQQLLEQFKLALANRYLPKTEKLDLSKQYGLFDEAGTVKGATEADELLDKITISYERNRKPTRKKLPKELLRVFITHDIAETDKHCACGLSLQRIGDEVTEQLDIIPLQLKVICHVRPKYACSHCQDKVKIKSMPQLFLPKSIASPGLASYIITTKYEDHIPLYRQEKIWKRYGIDLPRSSSCGIVLASAEQCELLISCLHENIRQSDYCQADETPVQVLKTPERSSKSNSYMWCYKAGPPLSPSIVFDYQQTRGGYHAQQFLEGFKGQLQCDGYSGYSWIAGFTNISRGGCMLHARRKFTDVIKISKSDGLAQQALIYFQKLYAVEKHARETNATAVQRYELRLLQAKPILLEFKEWLDKNINHVPPKQKIGEAISYTLNQWPHLISYLNDGRYEIDNNTVENLIRPFSLGRKNWMFMGSPRGAKAGAVLYSLIATAKANNLVAYDYLRYVFERIRDCREEKDYRQLLPQNLKDKNLMSIQ